MISVTNKPLPINVNKAPINSNFLVRLIHSSLFSLNHICLLGSISLVLCSNKTSFKSFSFRICSLNLLLALSNFVRLVFFAFEYLLFARYDAHKVSALAKTKNNPPIKYGTSSTLTYIFGFLVTRRKHEHAEPTTQNKAANKKQIATHHDNESYFQHHRNRNKQ